MVTGCNL